MNNGASVAFLLFLKFFPFFHLEIWPLIIYPNKNSCKILYGKLEKISSVRVTSSQGRVAKHKSKSAYFIHPVNYD
jgi:hypothetical protein